MAYTKSYPAWHDDPVHDTPIVASALNNIETGIANAHNDVASLTTRVAAEEAQPDVPAVVNGQWLKGAGGVAIWSSIAIADVASLQATLDGKAPLASAVMDGDAAGGVLTGTYPAPSFAADMATQAELDAINALRIASENAVQANLDAHIVDATAAHVAAAIGFTPVGTIGATTVQAAIAEVAAEGGGGGGGGVSYLSDLFDVTGTPPAVGEAPVWDGDSYELTDIVTASELTAAIGGIDMSTKVDKDSVVAATARLVATKLLVGDAQPAFRILGNGKHEWGPGGATVLDADLYRSGVGVLATTSRLNVINDSGIFVTGSTAGQYAYRAYVGAEAQPRLRISADGRIDWGPGGATVADISVYRQAAATLRTDGSLWVDKGLIVDYAGVGERIYFGTAADTNLYRSAANVLKSDDKFDPASFNVPTKAGVPVDGDVTGGAADGDMIVDTTGKIPYVRIGGSFQAVGGSLPNRLNIVSQTITDWNTALQNGWYMCSAGLNAPPALAGVWAMGEVVAHRDTSPVWLTQRVWDFTQGAGSQMYERRCLNDGWTSWFAIPAGYGTALPTGITDGYEFTLVDSLTAATFAWRLRHNGSRATNKWEFIGGSPKHAQVDTVENIANTAYVALATPGPSVAVPVAGIYYVSHGFTYLQVSSGPQPFMSYDIGGTPAVDADATMVGGPGGHYNTAARMSRKTLAAVTLVAKYKGSGTATAAGIEKRWIAIEPIAIGG